MNKIVIEGWDKDAGDKQVIVSIVNGEEGSPATILFEELDFSCSLPDLEAAIKHFS